MPYMTGFSLQCDYCREKASVEVLYLPPNPALRPYLIEGWHETLDHRLICPRHVFDEKHEIRVDGRVVHSCHG